MGRIVRFAALAALAVLVPAAIYGAATWAYWRNWARLDMDAPGRVLDASKYAPTAEVRARRAARPLPAGRPLAPERVATLQVLAQESGSFAFAVVQDESVRFAHYRAGLGPSTLFDSYNFHKTVLSLALGHAFEDGALGSLDRPASDYIPAWRADGRRAITVRQLLNHESGLRSAAGRFRPFDPVMDLFVGLDLDALVERAELVAPPGSQFDFTHLNAQALHEVLVGSTGRDYASILAEYLWTPLGAAPARIALDRAGGNARAICCFLATADSWLRLGALLANRGRFGGRQVVAESWIDEMLRPAPTNPNFGFNLWIGSPQTGRRLQSVQRRSSAPMPDRFAADDVYMIEASGAGRLYVVPSRRLAVLRFGAFEGMRPKWNDAAIVNAVLAAVD